MCVLFGLLEKYLNLNLSTILHPFVSRLTLSRHHHFFLRHPGAIGFQKLHEGILLLDQATLVLPG